MEAKNRLRQAILQLRKDLYTIENWLDYGIPSSLGDTEIKNYINKVGDRGKCISKHLSDTYDEIKLSYKIVK